MGKIGEWFRSWRWLSWRTAFVASFAAYTAIGFLVVPRVVHGLLIDEARKLTGREPTVGEVRFNPFTLALTIQDLSFPDRTGTALASFDELYANAQVSSLFRWAPTLRELRVTNPRVALRRFADGTVNVVELMDEVESRLPEGLLPESPPGEERGLPRLVLQHVLIEGTELVVEDAARPEPLLIELGPSRFELSDISTLPDRSGSNRFAIGLKRGGTIAVTGDVVVDPLALNGTVEIDRIFLDTTWPIVEPYVEFDVVSGDASGRFDYQLSLDDDGFRALIDRLDYRLTELRVEPRAADLEVLSVEAVTIEGGRFEWPEGKVRAERIGVESALAYAWLDADGAFSWAKLVPPPTQEQVVEAYHVVEASAPWAAEVDRFEVSGSGARFEDRTFDTPLELVVEDARLVLTGISSRRDARWGIEAEAALPGGAPASLVGELGVAPLDLDAEVAVKELDLGRFGSYLAREAPLDLRSGSVASEGRVTADAGEALSANFEGDVEITGLDLRETAVGSRLLRWKRVGVAGISAGIGPTSLRADAVDVEGVEAEAVLSAEGKISLLELWNEIVERHSTGADSEATEPASVSDAELPPLPPIEIGAITLSDCRATLIDRSYSPPFELGLEQVAGRIDGVSSTADSGAEIEIDGLVASGGSLKVAGEVDLLDPRRFADVEVSVRGADVPPLSPILVRKTGYPAASGEASLGLDYSILDNEVRGANRLTTQGFTLGDKVAGEGTMKLPVKLGVSLLTDKEGRIELEFPVEGRLGDPGFGIGSAIGAAVSAAVGDVAKSPFRALARLGGGKADQTGLEFVEFESGSAVLGADAERKLRTLASGAEQRPSLVLEVAGTWDPDADASALQRAAVDRLLEERAAAEGVPADSVDLLESALREAAGPEKVEELRRLSRPPDEAVPEDDVSSEDEYAVALRAALSAAQTIEESLLHELAAARGDAVRTLLVESTGLSGDRVRMLAPIVATDDDPDWVRLDLRVSAAD